MNGNADDRNMGEQGVEDPTRNPDLNTDAGAPTMGTAEQRAGAPEQRMGGGAPGVDTGAPTMGTAEQHLGADAPSTGAATPSMGNAEHAAEEHTATTDHDVIRHWADDRHATPATVAGTEHDGRVGELRLDLDFGNNLEDLKQVTWDEWFAAFDERGMEFVFREATRADGSVSNDFHVEEAGRARA